MKKINTKETPNISRSAITEIYLKDIRNSKPLTPAKEKELIRAAQKGDIKAQNTLVEANLKFVINVAANYQTPGIDIMDLVSAGNIGLIESIKTFNTDKEIKFISYAVWWIKNGCVEFLRENTKAVHLPFNQHEFLNKVAKQKEKLEKEFEGDVDNLYVISTLDEQDNQHAGAALLATVGAVSLDSPLGDDGDETVGDLLSNNLNSIDEEFEKQHRKLVVAKALDKLSTIQRQVIELSFGFNGASPQTNEDIAETLNLTAERIRQIKTKAIEQLQRKTLLRTAL